MGLETEAREWLENRIEEELDAGVEPEAAKAQILAEMPESYMVALAVVQVAEEVEASFQRRRPTWWPWR